MQHLTLGYLTLNAPPADTISAAAEAGFKSVGVRITGRLPSDPWTQVVGNPSMIEEIRSLIRQHRMRLSSVGAYLIGPGIEWEHLKPVVDTAAELGTSMIEININRPVDSGLKSLFRSYCEYAGQFGIRIALEFVPYSDVKTIGAALRLVEEAGYENAGLVIDSLHVARSGEAPSAIRAINPERIFLAQLCDAKKTTAKQTDDELRSEARTGRLVPGQGDLPLYDFLDALPMGVEIEYEVPLAAQTRLPLADRARFAAQQFRHYLSRYADERARNDLKNSVETSLSDGIR